MVGGARLAGGAHGVHVAYVLGLSPNGHAAGWSSGTPLHALLVRATPACNARPANPAPRCLSRPRSVQALPARDSPPCAAPGHSHEARGPNQLAAPGGLLLASTPGC